MDKLYLKKKLKGFVPFGPEWEKEIMKLPVKEIIALLRKQNLLRRAETDRANWYRDKLKELEKRLHG